MRLICKICIYVFLGSLSPWTGKAQMRIENKASTFRVDRISVSDGLAQGSVYQILKDSRGFLWFGTQDGLSRYDGNLFRNFRPTLNEKGAVQPGTIRGVSIMGILEDPNGNLWIGTDEGLNRYNRESDQFDYFLSGYQPKLLTTSRVIPFFINKTDLIYLSDSEGLVRFNYHTKQKTILDATLYASKKYDLQSGPIMTATDDIWLQQPTGLLRYNIHTQEKTYYFSNHPQNRYGQSTIIHSFYIDNPNKSIWIGTNEGLVHFNYKHQTQQKYTSTGRSKIGAIHSISSDQNGRLWLGTQQNGVLYFDKDTKSFGQISSFTNYIQPLTDFKISKVYTDNQGIIWANVDPDGLARIVPNTFLFQGITKQKFSQTQSPDQRLSNYTVRGFLEENPERIWILTENGINVLNPYTNRIIDRYLLKKNETTLKSVYRDSNGKIWVGTTTGILAFNAPTKTFEAIPFPKHLAINTYVRNIVQIGDETLVTATEDGLYLLNTRQRIWQKAPILPGQNIFSLRYDQKAHQLWVGTYLNGYYCFQLAPDENLSNSTSWKEIRSGLIGHTVFHFYPDTSAKFIWLSCAQGLVKLNSENTQFTLYSERNGLANSFVYGSLPDNLNRIWFSTNRGLSRLDPKTGHIKNFTPNDGLQGYEFNGNAFLKTSQGELYFGGVNGFNRFQPSKFYSPAAKPYIHIYALNINDEPVQLETYIGEAKTLNLKYYQNTIALEFGAIDYSSNGQPSYQYQLINYDQNRISAGARNYARYTNLPPGEYIFQVRAANQDGYWSPNIRTLLIHIEPPFWRTLPFILGIFLLALLASLAWIRKREDAIRKQQEERLRLSFNIQEQVKKDIARDIHDEIGTRLATIKLYTTQLTQQAGETPNILTLKNTIFQLINDTISDVRTMLRKLNPQTLERHGYIAAVEELFARISASDVINAQFQINEMPGSALKDNRLPSEIEVMLYRITQELVSNSLKHAQATLIELDITLHSHQITLVYKDNGQGFNYEHVQRKTTGLGISNIESRVVILGGKIHWYNQSNQGVQVTIDIPLKSVQKRYFFRFTGKKSVND